MVGDLLDERRSEPTGLLGEREMLEHWLEFHRMTLLLKCEGLDAEQLMARPVPTSKLSLHGLVRHMAEVERNWFTRCLLSAPITPYIFWDPEDKENEDNEMYPLDAADFESDQAVWKQECASSRENAARFDLEQIGSREGTEYSLRWIYHHMVEEYARHNGHADLIRELVDGAVGC